MKLTTMAWVLIGAAGLLGAGCSRASHHVYTTIPDADPAVQLKRFVSDKEAQSNTATNETIPEFAAFFTAARTGDWPAVSNAFLAFRNHAGQYEHSGQTDNRLRGTRWEAVKEVWGAFDAFGEGSPKYAAAFGRDIANSIPDGSIYFGGTDPGRFVVTAMCRSQVAGDPFYVLTQNALADSSYLDYIRNMYGDRLHLPTADDTSRCFEEYTADLKQRADKHQLRAGEDYHLDDQGKVQVQGQVAVMEINALIAKTIVDRNPGHEFYLEESFPLDWMYPCLEPHGLIFKLNPQPLSSLSDEVVSADHEYWSKYLQPMIGGWLTDETPVEDVAAFVGKTSGRRDLSSFSGDPVFIQDLYMRRSFSKLRSSIAGVYAWRTGHATGADKNRMAREADFAYRQSWALCPDSPEAIFRYVTFLMQQKRIADAVLVAQTAADVPSMQGRDGAQVRALLEQLKQYQKKN